MIIKWERGDYLTAVFGSYIGGVVPPSLVLCDSGPSTAPCYTHQGLRECVTTPG